MPAIGPDFKAGFVDDAPTGNIDLAPTLAHLLGLQMPSVGNIRGRVLEESLSGGKITAAGLRKVVASAPNEDGLSTLLEYQEIGGVGYYDCACVANADATKRCD